MEITVTGLSRSQRQQPQRDGAGAGQGYPHCFLKCSGLKACSWTAEATAGSGFVLLTAHGVEFTPAAAITPVSSVVQRVREDRLPAEVVQQ